MNPDDPGMAGIFSNYPAAYLSTGKWTKGLTKKCFLCVKTVNTKFEIYNKIGVGFAEEVHKCANVQC